MEYEKKYRPRWYQLMLLIIYTVVIVYTVLVNNPYLYSSKQYRNALAGKKDNSFTPVITELGKQRLELEEVQSPSRFSWNQAAQDQSEETRDRRYVEATLSPLLIELDQKQKNTQWMLLKNHILASTEDGKVFAMNYEGQTLWSFSSLNTKGLAFLPEPLADATSVYLANPSGHIYNIQLSDGKLLWSAEFEGELLSNAFAIGDSLFLVNKTLKTQEKKKKPVHQASLIRINRKTGELTSTSDDLGLKQLTNLSYSADLKTLFLTSAERLVAVKLPAMQSLWQKNLSSDVIGPAVVANDRILVTLKEGKLKIYSMSKGTELKETDLEHPIASPASYIPIYNRAAVITTDGYQHVVDLDSGKRLWRFDLNNKNVLESSWSARLSGNFIEELGMKWKYKGWTIWSPCVEKRICIYNPEKGQIVGRVMLSGRLVSMPRYLQKSFYVILEQETGFSLGHYIEKAAAN